MKGERMVVVDAKSERERVRGAFEAIVEENMPRDTSLLVKERIVALALEIRDSNQYFGEAGLQGLTRERIYQRKARKIDEVVKQFLLPRLMQCKEFSVAIQRLFEEDRVDNDDAKDLLQVVGIVDMKTLKKRLRESCKNK